jgi:hypothetical protein
MPRWRLRWTAAGTMEEAKGFRRLKAYKHLHVLRAALQPINQLAVCRRISSSVGTAFALR